MTPADFLAFRPSLAPQEHVIPDCAAFQKATDPLGALGNMAGGMSLVVAETTFPSSEQLYQAMRYSGRPDLQDAIRAARGGMAAKMGTRRPDPWDPRGRSIRATATVAGWDDLRFPAMNFTILTKCLQHWGRIRPLLESTGDLPIVEVSRRDPTWGAVPMGAVAIGSNALGQTWMHARRHAAWIDAIRTDVVVAPIPAGLTVIDGDGRPAAGLVAIHAP